MVVGQVALYERPVAGEDHQDIGVLRPAGRSLKDR